LELAGLAEPARWLPGDLPPFWLIDVAEAQAPPADSTITATEAGEALHRLTYYRANRMYLQLIPTVPSYRHQPLIRSGEDESRVGLRLARWPTDLLGRALSSGLTEQEVEWLAELDAHPLHADFERFANAPQADILGTRYQLPVAGGWDRLVPTELEPVREAFQAQWGRAALAAQRGDLDRTEEVLRAVVGGALQMVRSAPFEVDVVEALDFLGQALRSLAAVAEARGSEPPDWLERLEADESESWMGGIELRCSPKTRRWSTIRCPSSSRTAASPRRSSASPTARSCSSTSA
jgi:hypothetical protein